MCLLLTQRGAETVELGHTPRRQRDCKQVGDIKQQRARKHCPVESRQSEADHGQGRHQGSRNRHADNRALFPSDHRISAGERGKQCHEEVEQVGPRPCRDFLRDLLQGRHEHHHCAQSHCHQRPPGKRLRRLPEPVIIPDRQCETEAHDWPHQRRKQHGPDHHRRRGQEQAEDRDTARHGGHEHIARRHQAVLTPLGDHGCLIDRVYNRLLPPHAQADHSAQEGPFCQRGGLFCLAGRVRMLFIHHHALIACQVEKKAGSLAASQAGMLVFCVLYH